MCMIKVLATLLVLQVICQVCVVLQDNWDGVLGIRLTTMHIVLQDR